MRVLHAALLSRVAVVLWAALFAALFAPYDASRALDEPTCAVSGGVDRALRVVLEPLASWDALHYLRVARVGYAVEKSLAFLPGLPLALVLGDGALSPFMSMVVSLCPRTRMLLVGVLLSNACFVGAVLALHALTLRVWRDEERARWAALLLCISPASVFFSSLYTESLFALLSFGGLMYLARDQVPTLWLLSLSWLTFSPPLEHWRATWVFMAASLVRANGVLLMLPLLAHQVQRYRFLSALIQSLLVTFPVACYLFVAHVKFCLASHDARSTWCLDALPNAYAYVQAHYWHNGLFAYWELRNVPHFLLAAPALFIAAAGCRHAMSHPPNAWMARALVLQWGGMALLCLLTMNVQVATRFLSSCPPLYWFGARLVAEGGFTARLWVAYSVAYAVAGTALFATFYPWT